MRRLRGQNWVHWKWSMIGCQIDGKKNEWHPGGVQHQHDHRFVCANIFDYWNTLNNRSSTFSQNQIYSIKNILSIIDMKTIWYQASKWFDWIKKVWQMISWLICLFDSLELFSNHNFTFTATLGTKFESDTPNLSAAVSFVLIAFESASPNAWLPLLPLFLSLSSFFVEQSY